GNPAPPRPFMPDSLIVATTSSGARARAARSPCSASMVAKVIGVRTLMGVTPGVWVGVRDHLRDFCGAHFDSRGPYTMRAWALWAHRPGGRGPDLQGDRPPHAEDRPSHAEVDSGSRRRQARAVDLGVSYRPGRRAWSTTRLALSGGRRPRGRRGTASRARRRGR